MTIEGSHARGLEDRTPVVVAAAQRTQKSVDPGEALGPLELMEACAREAADACGGGRRLLAAIDRLAVVDAIGWRWRNAPALLAERLGARPREAFQTVVGGNVPQRFLNETARRVAGGECRVALVAGAEAIHSLRRARRAGVRPAWEAGGEGEPARFGEAKAGTSELENRAGLTLPPIVYPLFENALRARCGETIDAHRARLGRLMAGFAAVAARNPRAWFREARSAAEIAAPSADNRMISFPYPKYMNAILDVDQGAAAIVASAGAARALGIPEERFVYWWGGGDAIEEAWFPTERPDLSRAPALCRAGAQALAEAGLAIDEIDVLDLYSCFPVAVQMAREALGIGEDDARELTVTGGLPYAGGPGNAYTLCSLASLAERLRARPGAKGLLTGVGWYMTRHSVGVFASAPPPSARSAKALEPNVPAPPPAVAVVGDATGSATIESYTVVHERDGAPARGIVVARLADGRRCLAHTPTDRDVLEALERAEGVGRRGRLSAGEPVARFDLD
jgi:acetyl-CoA C-acetyltransferase